jgi:hypothetical protein
MLYNNTIMLYNKQKAICHAMIIVVTILLLGYSCVFAFPFQTTIHHHKIFGKKQVSSSSGGGDSSSSHSSDVKGSDNSNNEGNSNNNNKNNNQGTNDGSNTGADNNLQSTETDQQQQQQGGGENVAPIDTSIPTPTPQTLCKQGSNCTDQQGLSDRDRSSTASSAGTSGQDNNTPFVLPFP